MFTRNVRARNYARVLILVNCLLTIFGKVNILGAVESQFENRGLNMKMQQPARFSFWNWLLGGGTTNGGGTSG